MKTIQNVQGGALLIAVLLASCTTVNELDTVDLRGARVAAYLAIPPEPEVDVSYDLTFNPENPIATAVSIGANLAKATIATGAEQKMREALASVDLPEQVMEKSFATLADMLGVSRVYVPGYPDSRDADYLFEFEVRSYGIEADSPAGEVSFSLSAVAALRELRFGDLVWRRSVSVDLPAHPGLFGLPAEVGTAISAAALSNLTEAQMRSGFEQLVAEASLEFGRRLERDLYAARYR